MDTNRLAAVLFATALAGPALLHGNVISVPATGIIDKPANYFDLEGTTVTFTPNDAGEYTVAVGDLSWRDSADGAKTVRQVLRHESHHLTVDLPFAFPFADRNWTRVYVNANGNISFQRSEGMNWQHRDPWADASMRSVAAAIDSRAAAGLEAMIAVLWAPYDPATVTVDSGADGVAITWRALRTTAVNIFYRQLGESLFQARLLPSGVIELAYRAVPERDGIVGLFHGRSGAGRIVGSIADAGSDVSHGILDVRKAELVDKGSTLLATITLAQNVPERITRSSISYDAFLSFGGTDCSVGVVVDAEGRRPFASWCGPQPSRVGSRVQGRTVQIPISKTLLNGLNRLSWSAGAVWWDEDFDGTERQTVQIGKPDYDLRALSGPIPGNVFEVFHYPTVAKHQIEPILSHIYRRVPAEAEIAVMFTDFRMDDLFNSGGAAGTINEAIMGIGEGPATPHPGERYGSDRLLTSMMPVFIGAPNFSETGVSWEGREYGAFSPGIRWIGSRGHSSMGG